MNTSDFDRAETLFRRGDLVAARGAAEAALRKRPDESRLHRLLGLTLCHQGDLAGGASRLRVALDLDASDREARVALAHALAMTGEHEAALDLTSDEPDLLRLRAWLLQERGAHRQAAQAYEAVLAAAPNDAECVNNLGNSRRAAGDAAGAVEALERARALAPHIAPIHFNLGLALVETGDTSAAEEAFREAARLDPGNAAALVELGKLLSHRGLRPEALAAFRRAEALAPASPSAPLERARALTAWRQLSEAEEAYREALARDPGSVAAWLELGIVLERDNRIGGLEALLEDAGRSGVAERDLLYLRALWLRRQNRLEEALAAAQAAPAHVEPVRRQALIGRLADKLGRIDEAFAAYEEMNRATAETDVAVDPEAYRRRIEMLTEQVTPDWYGSWTPPASVGEREPPVFLVGFPRSGTTLLDTMLMGHPGLFVLEEEPLLQAVEDALGGYGRLPGLEAGGIDALRRVYFEGLDALAPPQGRLVVDKLPLNILGAPLIHRLFPDARFIFAQRHPCDVVLSGFMQDFELNDAMANFLSLSDAARLYELVLAFWTRCREVLPLRVVTVRYETLVAEPEAALRPAIDFLGLDWDDRLLDHRGTAARRGTIITPSYSQVVEPLYGQASGRWERYASHMAPVLPRLAPWAERLGYPPVDLPA